MKEYALITGASKGIGKSIALLLAKQGYNLLLVARSENELAELSANIRSTYYVDAFYFAVDLSAPGAAEQIATWCSQKPVSILVNNAGYGLWGDFETLDLAGQMSMIKVNIDALVELCYYFIPVLRPQKQAYILNVASTAAYQAVPTLAIYAATKAYVLSFSRALRYELKDSPVSVSCLCPGPTDTGFAQRAGMEALAELAAKFNMSADDVAGIGLKGMFRKKAEIIPGILNKVSAAAVAFSPKSFIERVTAGLYKK